MIKIYALLIVSLAAVNSMTLESGHRHWATLARSGDAPLNQENDFLPGEKGLKQPVVALLNAALAKITPLLGRVIRVIPDVATGLNTVNTVINNSISNGFAIPLPDEEYIGYHYQTSATRKHEKKSESQNEKKSEAKIEKETEGKIEKKSEMKSDRKARKLSHTKSDQDKRISRNQL